MYLNKAYFSSAFDLSRHFLHEWTVNWRFIDEKTFLSRERAVGLLIGHVSDLSDLRAGQAGQDQDLDQHPRSLPILAPGVPNDPSTAR